jgi:tRNA pseudouridine55 synthase
VLNGWLIIRKPVGPTSTQVVGAVKRALREGGYPKVKVGHGGTLDPLASGVLPIALGEATKLSGRLLDSDKIYQFTIEFGVETDTLDVEGQEVARSAKRPLWTEIAAVLPRFRGRIEQVPPAFSAIKVDGQRAYARARAGEEVSLPSRPVAVHLLDRWRLSAYGAWLEGQSYDPHSKPGRRDPAAEAPLKEATFLAHVSKGTYIRSLARDIAHAVDSVGHVTMLHRSKAGPFTLERAISLDKLGEAAKARSLEEHLLPLTAGLDDIPALPVTPDQAGALRQGRTLIGIAAQPGLYLATDRDVPVALVELSEDELRVLRGFNL